SHRRLAGAAARARTGTLRSAENVEEVRRQTIVPQLDGPRSLRPTGERLWHLGHGADGVEQHLGGQSPSVMAREVLLVVAVGVVVYAGQLIDPRGQNQPRQGLEIVVLLDEVSSEVI